MARTRPHHPGDDDLGSLFGNSPVDRAMQRVPPVPVPSDVRALAERVPHHLRLGTSSWAYPGWRGMIFGARAAANALARDGLAAYAAWPLFGTVGLDRAFYSTPSVSEYEALASLVPAGFRFTVKAEQRCTRPDMDGAGSTLGSTTVLRAGGVANPHFMDPSFIRDEVLAPAVAGLGVVVGHGHAGRTFERSIDRDVCAVVAQRVDDRRALGADAGAEHADDGLAGDGLLHVLGVRLGVHLGLGLLVGDDLRLARQAAVFKASYRLSLADAFAAALAKEKKAELVTGDPEFKALEKEIKIVWLK
jgi:hypothetical protein